MKTAIFLGAGASASEGAPLQTHLFRDYFELIKQRRLLSSTNHEKELKRFFYLMFDIDVNNTKLDKILFPTFEEALGILDLADLRNESFKDFPNISFATNSSKIAFLRLYLVFLMADIINDSLHKGKEIHKNLITNLKSLNQIKNIVFVTTNYDILCDNALLNLFPTVKVDYGVDFINYKDGSFIRPDLKSVKLFKLHGSLNWLYCPTCNNLRITPYEKGVYNLMVDPENSECNTCRTAYSPIIVPPTFYKDLSKVFLNQVWNKTEQELLDTDHIIFCGYSFPDADIHIKYLLKRVQKNRLHSNNLRFSVVNNYRGKKPEVKKEEKERYKRFLGANVEYTNFSFEQFSDNPELLLT